MNWIKNGTQLKGETVELLPLEEKHFEELDVLAQDNRIWEFIPIDMSTIQKRSTAFINALMEREQETQYPFVVRLRKTNKLIGSTRLMDLQPLHRKAEIGWTWLHPDYWATEINVECKLLLLSFCFEQMQTVRVQLKTDENNIRSRKAIEKIGGKYEGVLRKDMKRDNGTFRNSVYFSILDTEWEFKKPELQKLYRKPSGH